VYSVVAFRITTEYTEHHGKTRKEKRLI